MSECYEIPDPKYYNGEFGTIQQPHLYKITFGQRFKNSLNFHCKIGPDFFIYRVRCINRKTLNLDCAEHQNSLRKISEKHPDGKKPRGCRSKLKLAVLAGFIKASEYGRRRAGHHKRTKFELDFSDPKILEIGSYQVLPCNSESHNFNCGKTFFDPIRKDFRHAHVRAGLILNEPAFDETLTRFGLLERFGLDFQVKSTGSKSAELQAFYYQNRKITRDVPKNKVPPKFSKILRTNFRNGTFGSYEENWHQFSSPKQEIFYLTDELDLLEQHPVYVDGTFTLVKDQDFTQIYIISVLFKHGNRTFSYPVVLSLMRGRTGESYREFFGHLAQIFHQKNDRPLEIPKIISDAEAAIFKPIKEIYPQTTLKLCKVHILRNWRKKLIECFGQVQFLTDQNLVNFWLLLRGIFFIPAILMIFSNI